MLDSSWPDFVLVIVFLKGGFSVVNLGYVLCKHGYPSTYPVQGAKVRQYRMTSSDESDSPLRTFYIFSTKFS